MVGDYTMVFDSGLQGRGKALEVGDKGEDLSHAGGRVESEEE